jgi:hypothetical protein
MNSSEIRQRRGDIQNIVYLLFGGSFLGIILIVASYQIGGWIGFVIAYAGIGLLLLAFYLDKRKDLSSYLDAGPKGRHFVAYFAIVAGGTIGLAVIGLAMLGLATLAAGGNYASGTSRTGYDYSNYLLFGILWLLLGIPHRAFKYELDRSGEGSAQRFLLGVLVIAASILTGIYILTSYLSSRPLHGISIQVLISGIIFTIFLIMPAYRSLSRACWQRGIRSLFSPKPLTERWSKAITELDKAFYQAQATDRFLARRKLGETPGNNTLDGSNSDEYRTDPDPDPRPDPRLGPGHEDA